eukprot:1141576-Pelagomonas_calceolata.AAC.3
MLETTQDSDDSVSKSKNGFYQGVGWASSHWLPFKLATLSTGSMGCSLMERVALHLSSLSHQSSRAHKFGHTTVFANQEGGKTMDTLPNFGVGTPQPIYHPPLPPLPMPLPRT